MVLELDYKLFKDLIIDIWTIVYDNDPERMYSFNDFEKAISSIEGSISCYIDDEDYDEAVEFVIEFINAHKSESCIPIKFGNLNITIYKWSLDYTTNIHQILSECYDKLKDENLRTRIKWLYNAKN